MATQAPVALPPSLAGGVGWVAGKELRVLLAAVGVKQINAICSTGHWRWRSRSRLLVVFYAPPGVASRPRLSETEGGASSDHCSSSSSSDTPSPQLPAATSPSSSSAK
eukprot:COSAG03_NODE_40_length_17307_cov_3.149457_14_plen_108_part_00